MRKKDHTYHLLFLVLNFIEIFIVYLAIIIFLPFKNLYKIIFGQKIKIFIYKQYKKYIHFLTGKIKLF